MNTAQLTLEILNRFSVLSFYYCLLFYDRRKGRLTRLQPSSRSMDDDLSWLASRLHDGAHKTHERRDFPHPAEGQVPLPRNLVLDLFQFALLLYFD